MIANFYEVFKKPDAHRILPDAVVEALSASLPHGYRYERSPDGNYMVVPAGDGEACSFKGSIDRAANKIPDSVPDDRLLEYAYRTQRSLRIKRAVLGDGKKSMLLEDVHADPITHERNGTVTEAWLVPKAFPPVPPLSLKTGDGLEISVEMERRPSESLNSTKFASVSFSALSIEVEVSDEGKLVSGRVARASTIHVSAIPRKGGTVHDAVLSLLVLSSFASGTLVINGASIADRRMDSDEAGLDTERIEESLRFWKTLERLEKEIGVAFDPGVELEEEDLTLLRNLVGGLLDHKEVVISNPFSHFHIDFEEETQLAELEGRVGKSGLSLSFVEMSHVDLLGAGFDVYTACVLVDMVLERIVYDEDGRGAEFYINDVPGLSFKVVERLCLSERDALEAMGPMYERHAGYEG